MKKNFIILFIYFLHTFASAQITSIYGDYFPDSSHTYIGASFDYGINSNALSNNFIKKFYKGGYIDNDLKNQVSERVKNENRVGGDINYSVFVSFKPDSVFHKKNVSLFFSARDREHLDIGFSKDLFNVSFYGNADYAGKTANFNNFNMHLLRYQQLQIGLFAPTVHGSAKWGLALSFLKGEQYASITAKKAELYTSADGQFIDFNTSMQVAQSDTSKKGLGAFNGYGSSLDVYFEAPYKTKIGNSKIKISVTDIGLIHFNDQSLYLNQDSLFHYTGFKVNSIYDLKDSTFATTSQDSIIKRVVPFHKKAYNVTLPATLNLSFETQFNKHFRLTEGIHYVFNSNYNLYSYIKGDFFINKKIILSGTVGYGGYGNFSYGLGILANMGKGFIVYAGSNNIAALIVPQKTCGQGAYISLIKNFN